MTTQNETDLGALVACEEEGMAALAAGDFDVLDDMLDTHLEISQRIEHLMPTEGTMDEAVQLAKDVLGAEVIASE